MHATPHKYFSHEKAFNSLLFSITAKYYFFQKNISGQRRVWVNRAKADQSDKFFKKIGARIVCTYDFYWCRTVLQSSTSRADVLPRTMIRFPLRRPSHCRPAPPAVSEQHRLPSIDASTPLRRTVQTPDNERKGRQRNKSLARRRSQHHLSSTRAAAVSTRTGPDRRMQLTGHGALLLRTPVRRRAHVSTTVRAAAGCSSSRTQLVRALRIGRQVASRPLTARACSSELSA